MRVRLDPVAEQLGLRAVPRPAAPARDRHGAGRRAALHPVRRAGRRAVAGERRELVQLLDALPAHIGFIIIEHDLDVALRVVERVTVMHNGRHLQARHAGGDRGRRRGAAHLSGRRAPWLIATAAVTGRPAPAIEIADLHVYYGHAHALQGVSLTPDQRRARPWSAATAWARRRSATRSWGWCPRARAASALAGDEILGLPPNRDRQSGRRLRAAGPARLALAHGGRASAPGRQGLRSGPWTVERIYQTFPRLAERRRHGGAQLSGGEQQMLAISRGAAGQSAPAGDGRADGGPGAGHRRPGRRDADAAGRAKARSRCC